MEEDGDAEVGDDDWSPTSGEAVKEQYMFLGNVYTVTKPRKVTKDNRTPEPALVAVTPAVVTEEDLHVWKENECNGIDYPNEKTLGGESNHDDEVEKFWMELDMTNDGLSLPSKNDITRVTKNSTSDIVRPGVLPLRTVLE